MNLRKATKKQLIQEIRRLRLIEKCAEQYRKDIKRRDEATAKYRRMEKEVLTWALSFELIEKDWDYFWKCACPWDTFWEERKADRVSEFMKYIEDTFTKEQLEAMKKAIEPLLPMVPTRG